jgi:hypothetical protein
MSDHPFNRLAATLDHQAMSGVCHRATLKPVALPTLAKNAFTYLAGLLHRAGARKVRD